MKSVSSPRPQTLVWAQGTVRPQRPKTVLEPLLAILAEDLQEALDGWQPRRQPVAVLVDHDLSAAAQSLFQPLAARAPVCRHRQRRTARHG